MLSRNYLSLGLSLAGLVSSVLYLTGCGDGGAGSGAPSSSSVPLSASVSSSASASEPSSEPSSGTVLRVGYQQGGSSTLPMIAREEKYFERAGVQTDFVLFTSSSDGLNALNANKLDLGVSFGTCAPLTFASKGSKFVIIAGNLSGGHPVMVKPEYASQYRSIQDFRGKTVGTPRIFTSDVVFRGALHDAGIDQEKDLKIVEFKRPIDVLEAVKSGKVDVGIGVTNTIGRALQSGLALPLWSNDFFPNHPCCRIVATEEAIRDRRPELVRFLKGLLLADKKFSEDPESGVRADINQQKFSEKLARDLVLEPHSQLSADPNRKGVENMWSYMRRSGYAKGDLDLSKVIDTSLYEEALGQLRKESPDPYWEKLAKRFEEQNR